MEDITEFAGEAALGALVTLILIGVALATFIGGDLNNAITGFTLPVLGG